MEIIRNILQLKRRLSTWKRNGYQIGFVPTLGALHAGHARLIKQSVKETDKTVVSIFVNSLQFGPREDFKRYPRPFKQDIKLCRQEKVDVVFYPSKRLIYPSDFKTFVDMHDLPKSLCGRLRPIFFRGVMTIVTKFFNIVEPHIAYFGQKDYQQTIIIQQMVRDLNMNLKIKILPVVREKDGLAISSRNVYLTPRQRGKATCLWKGLVQARRLIKSNETSASKIIKQISKVIKQVKNTKIDYIEIVDARTLQPIKQIFSTHRILIALAVQIGKTRLIDNILVRP